MNLGPRNASSSSSSITISPPTPPSGSSLPKSSYRYFFNMTLLQIQRKIWIFLLCSGCFVYLAVSGFPSGVKGIISNSSSLPIYPPEGEEFSAVCNTSSLESSYVSSYTHNKANNNKDNLPWIYFITPTYSRREQIAELTRLGQTLLHIPNLHWILAEDSMRCSPLVEAILQRFGIPYTHIISPMPDMYKKKEIIYKPRGVSSRRAAIKWVLQNSDPSNKNSVIYFADDDNTYDLRLFDELRKTKRVSMFPVGFIGTQGISSPIVKDGKVVGFTDDWFANRQFPVDMAGFAINTQFLSQRRGDMPYKAGHEEDLFLRSIKLKRSEIDILANDCTEVLVWHTKAEQKKSPPLKLEHNLDTSLLSLINDLSDKGMAKVSQKGHELKTCFAEACNTIKN